MWIMMWLWSEFTAWSLEMQSWRFIKETSVKKTGDLALCSVDSDWTQVFARPAVPSSLSSFISFHFRRKIWKVVQQFVSSVLFFKSIFFHVSSFFAWLSLYFSFFLLLLLCHDSFILLSVRFCSDPEFTYFLFPTLCLFATFIFFNVFLKFNQQFCRLPLRHEATVSPQFDLSFTSTRQNLTDVKFDWKWKREEITLLFVRPK